MSFGKTLLQYAFVFLSSFFSSLLFSLIVFFLFSPQEEYSAGMTLSSGFLFGGAFSFFAFVHFWKNFDRKFFLVPLLPSLPLLFLVFFFGREVFEGLSFLFMPIFLSITPLFLTLQVFFFFMKKKNLFS